MTPETQNATIAEVASRHTTVAKLVVAFSVVGLFSGGSAGLVTESGPKHEIICEEQACGQTALQNLLQIPLPSLAPLPVLKPVQKVTKEPKPLEIIRPTTAPVQTAEQTPAGKRQVHHAKQAPALPDPRRAQPAIRFRGQSLETVDGGFPQCEKHNETKLQKDRPDAGSLGKVIVGVNHGYPLSVNKCLPAMLEWASAADAVQFYLNSSNPGVANPKAHGWAIAKDAVATLMAASPAGTKPTDYGTAWVDVETVNTWQYGSDKALLQNERVVEGEVAYLEHIGMKVGIYSVNSVVKGISPFTGKPGYSMFHHIVGDVPEHSNLNGLPNWLATGDNSLELAQEACHYDPLTPTSRIVLTQYGKDGWDYDYVCP